MKFFRNLLLVFFIIFLIIIAIEILFLYLAGNKLSANNLQTIKTSQTVQTSETSLPTISISAEKKQQDENILKNINQSILFYRDWFKNNDNERIYLTIEQPGVVNTIFTKEGSKVMLITNEKGEKISGFSVTDNIKFYKIMNGQKEIIPFDEVKQGDKIIIHVEVNLLTKDEKLEFILP